MKNILNAKVLFVCTGNTCRSPMAAGVFNKLSKEKGLDAVAESAGLMTENGMKASENAVTVCAENGIALNSHRSRQLTQEIVNTVDYIVPVSPSHTAALLRAGIQEEKIILPPFAIPDPYGGNLQIYRECFRNIKLLAESILKN